MNRQDLRIVVEGMDGSGKTTLVNNIQFALDDFQFEVVRNPKDDKQDFVTWWPEVVDRQKSDIIPIHDRFFFSELVYGPVLRGNVKAPEVLVTNIAFFLRSTSFLVYARPHSNILRQVIFHPDKVDMAGVRENYELLLEVYDRVMSVEQSWFGERFFHFDWNSPDSFQKLQERLRKYLDGKLR